MLPLPSTPVIQPPRALKRRGCLPLTAVRSSQQSNVDFPDTYVPPGTKKWSQERGSHLPLTQGTPAQQRSPSNSPSPPPTPLQKLASGSEQRQWRLQQSFNLKQARQQAPPGSPAAGTPAASQSQGQGYRGTRGTSMSDSQLDAVATQCLRSWFAGAPPPTKPQPLQPGVLDHEDPHVVSQAITALMDAQQLEEAVKAVTYIVTKNRTRVLELLQHKPFMVRARELKASRQAFNLLRVLPPQFCFTKSFTMALDVCAEARDLATGTALFDMAERTLSSMRRRPDLKMMTTYIKVCKSAGNADKAYSVFLSMKQRRMSLDAYVYCVLIAAFGEAMHRELTVAHERKDQYVLLERAYGILMEAEKSGVTLNEAPWNAVLTCAGRCGQLRRGFEILDLMQLHGVAADVISLGSLVEACVLAGNADLALKMFNRVLSEGFEKSVELYTQAVSACKLRGSVDLDTALKIYAHMQLNNIQPDKKFFAALIATAGAAGRLDLAFEMLSDIQAEGIIPGSTVCSGLILACIKDHRFHLAQKVYDLCADKGIYPALSLFNNLMDWYAGELRLGDVVRLLTDMTQHAKLQPNMNTYRILLNACQRTNQGALAFEIYEIMKAKRLPILQEKVAQSLYYLLFKCCLNQQRSIWAEVLDHKHNAMAPWRTGLHTRNTVLMEEAEQTLRALGSSLHARGSRSLLLKDNDVSTWANCAVSAYRDMATKGWKPNYDVLNMLLSCLRLPLQAPSVLDRPEHEDDQLLRAAGRDTAHAAAAAPHAHGLTPATTAIAAAETTRAAGVRGASEPSASASQGSSNRGNLAKAQTAPGAVARGAYRRYNGAFDTRAVALVEDAIARYALPRFTVDKDCVADLRGMPPVLAEVYVMTIFAAWERRAARARTLAGVDQSAAGSSSMFFHRLRLLVPPFPLEFINWPSYLPRQKDPSFSSVDGDDTHDHWRGLTDSGMSSSGSDSDQDEGHTPKSGHAPSFAAAAAAARASSNGTASTSSINSTSTPSSTYAVRSSSSSSHSSGGEAAHVLANGSQGHLSVHTPTVPALAPSVAVVSEAESHTLHHLQQQQQQQQQQHSSSTSSSDSMISNAESQPALSSESGEGPASDVTQQYEQLEQQQQQQLHISSTSSSGSTISSAESQSALSSEPEEAPASGVAQQYEELEQLQQQLQQLQNLGQVEQQQQQHPQSSPPSSRAAATTPTSTDLGDPITYSAAELTAVHGTASELAAHLPSHSPSDGPPSTSTPSGSQHRPSFHDLLPDGVPDKAHIEAPTSSAPSHSPSNGQGHTTAGAHGTPIKQEIAELQPPSTSTSQGEVLPMHPQPQPSALAAEPLQAQGEVPRMDGMLPSHLQPGFAAQGEVPPMAHTEGHVRNAERGSESYSAVGSRSGSSESGSTAQRQQQQQQRHLEQGLGSSHGSGDLSNSSSSSSSHDREERGRSWRGRSGFEDPALGQSDADQPSTSYDLEGTAPTVRPRSPGSRHRFPKHTFTPNSKTGSAVAATCLRMKVFANFNPSEGIIDLTPTEIVKWVRARHIWQLRMRGMLGVSGAPQGAVAQSSFSARDDVTAPSIDEADLDDNAFVGASTLQPRLGGGVRSLSSQRRPFVVPPLGAKQSMRGSSHGMGRPAGGRGPYGSSDDSDDSDAERNDFGAWSPVPHKSRPASRLQQQQRDIRLGLAPRVRRPQAVSADRPKKDSEPS